MKKLSIFLFAPLFLLLISCQHTAEEKTPVQEEKISSAYEALNFFANRTIYPNNSIPENAFFEAWQLQDRMPTAEGNGRVNMPWELMPPYFDRIRA